TVGTGRSGQGHETGVVGVPHVLDPVGQQQDAVNALVITSLFAFRARDVARLAAYFLFSTPRVALGNACLVVVAGGVTLVATEAALTLLGSVFASALLLNSRPLIAEVTEKFTLQGGAARGDAAHAEAARGVSPEAAS
ncbi:hypothetical protein AB0J37_18580, partial [Microbispora rosea]